jgi:hypothetical protein
VTLLQWYKAFAKRYREHSRNLLTIDIRQARRDAFLTRIKSAGALPLCRQLYLIELSLAEKQVQTIWCSALSYQSSTRSSIRVQAGTDGHADGIAEKISVTSHPVATEGSGQKVYIILYLPPSNRSSTRSSMFVYTRSAREPSKGEKTMGRRYNAMAMYHIGVELNQLYPCAPERWR